MNKIKYIIKYSPLVYNLYFYIVSGLIQFHGLFVKCDKKMILFNVSADGNMTIVRGQFLKLCFEDERFKRF